MIQKINAESILTLFKSHKTVFTIDDIALLWREDNRNNLRVRIKYFVDKGDLVRLRRGIYARQNYDVFEAVTRVYTPSYISCETVLQKEGVIFQHYDTIFVISYLSRSIALNDCTKIHYRKIKDDMLLNEIGLRREGQYMIASKERAFVDMVYLYGVQYFDNIDAMNWDLCKRIACAYESKALIKYINSYCK